MNGGALKNLKYRTNKNKNNMKRITNEQHLAVICNQIENTYAMANPRKKIHYTAMRMPLDETDWKGKVNGHDFTCKHVVTVYADDDVLFRTGFQLSGKESQDYLDMVPELVYEEAIRQLAVQGGISLLKD